VHNLSYVASLVRVAYGEDREKGFKEILLELRCSRKTAFYWLKTLEDQGFLSSFYLPSGRGRPRLHYRTTEKLLMFKASSPPSSPKIDGADIRTKKTGSMTVRPIAANRVALDTISVKGGPSKEGDEVTISFRRLQHACSHRKGGMCKALLPRTLQRCELYLCSIISAKF